ncbi:gem-associated protein 6 [Fopius arisanus]|uniref:GEMIN6 protein n=1 Tax=Fopius arisanus TaxID=64838 RepID=A0A0C9QXW4_9HYME|nr:PREDICTED: gem-associated protein 6-like [Fopius arisanus]
MSNGDESKYSHRIYKNDPVKYKNYVDKRAKITCKDSSIYEGIVYTVDPVSESVILINPKNSDNCGATILMGGSIKSIEILENSEDSLPEFFLQEKPEMSKADIQLKKEELKKLLMDNRIPVVDDNDVLTIQDVVSLEPPYDSCLCANPIIMSRIQGILSQLKTK